MNVKVISEAGHEAALLGLSLSYNSEPSERVANKLAHKHGGHNKFLESIVVWLDTNAPRYWWQQFDTYRVGVTKQSESSMHTIMRKSMTQDNFGDDIDQRVLDVLNECIKGKDWIGLKIHLPESFLQRRIVCTNYKTLQNMEYQRRSHKLPEWQYFLDSVLSEVTKPEWIRRVDDN